MNELTTSANNFPSVDSYEEAVEKIPVIRDVNLEDKNSIDRLLNAISAFNGIVDAGRRAITNSKSVEEISELNKRTMNAAQTANSLIVYGQMRIGELLKQIPKATANNNPSGKTKEEAQNRERPNLGKTKAEVVKDLGLSKDQVSDYQTLAKNPEVVEQVLREAKESGKVVSMAEMQRKIKEAKLQGRYDADKDYHHELEKAKNDAAFARSELAKLRNQTEEAKSLQRLLDQSYYFCNTCRSFLQEVGGLGFIADQIMDLPPKELADYKKAIFAVLAWAQNLTDYIGG